MAKTKEKFYNNRESHLQNGIYLLILVTISLLCWPLSPSPSADAHGILLPQSNPYPAINPDTVTVDYMKPQNATLVGRINTKIHYQSTSSSSDDLNLQKNLLVAKDLAAEYGANIVVVNNVGRTIERGPLDGFVVYAEAYHDK